MYIVKIEELSIASTEISFPAKTVTRTYCEDRRYPPLSGRCPDWLIDSYKQEFFLKTFSWLQNPARVIFQFWMFLLTFISGILFGFTTICKRFYQFKNSYEKYHGNRQQIFFYRWKLSSFWMVTTKQKNLINYYISVVIWLTWNSFHAR